MKSKIIRITLALFVIASFIPSLQAQKKKKADKDTQLWRYEIE